MEQNDFAAKSYLSSISQRIKNVCTVQVPSYFIRGLDNSTNVCSVSFCSGECRPDTETDRQENARLCNQVLTEKYNTRDEKALWWRVRKLLSIVHFVSNPLPPKLYILVPLR